MPTYFVNSSNIKFKKNIKEKLSKKITKVHKIDFHALNSMGGSKDK